MRYVPVCCLVTCHVVIDVLCWVGLTQYVMLCRNISRYDPVPPPPPPSPRKNASLVGAVPFCSLPPHPPRHSAAALSQWVPRWVPGCGVGVRPPHGHVAVGAPGGPTGGSASGVGWAGGCQAAPLPPATHFCLHLGGGGGHRVVLWSIAK